MHFRPCYCIGDFIYEVKYHEVKITVVKYSVSLPTRQDSVSPLGEQHANSLSDYALSWNYVPSGSCLYPSWACYNIHTIQGFDITVVMVVYLVV